MASCSILVILWITIFGFLARLEDETTQQSPLTKSIVTKDSLIQRSIVMNFASQRKLGNRGNTTYPNIRRCRMHALYYISLALILNASDTEMNPVPRTPKYPCQICSKAVTWKQRGVACDDCEKWFHADCRHMSTPVYMALNNISWHCTNCGMPNFISSLFDSTIMGTHNSFSSLESSNISDTSVQSPGPPTSCSSPSNH